MSAPPAVVFTREPGVMPETARLDVVAFVTVANPALNRFANKSDDDATVEKNDVLVAFVPVAFTKVKFWSVVEPVSRRFPNVCNAVNTFAVYVFGIVVEE